MSGGNSENLGSLLNSDSTNYSGYAPADFGDAEEMRPHEIAMDPTGTGLTAPYSHLVNNVISRHMAEIHDVYSGTISTPGNWKKKMRDFMRQKNDDLLRFLRKPVVDHPTLGQAEGFMKRFGRPDFQITTNSLQTKILELSGDNINDMITAELAVLGPSSPLQLLEQIKWLHENYRQAGELLMQYDSQLKLKLDMLDKSFQRVLSFMELPVNAETEKLSQSIQAYMKHFFDEYEIETLYNNMMAAYRRFIALREQIQMFRFLELTDKEPLCSICLQEPVAFTLSPCGHTFCSTCAKRQMTTCYMCRTHIRERIRIFFT